MKVLSLFDGMSCGQIALKRLGIRTETYYASEIDRHAIRQTQLNFPDTIQLGDVTQVDVRQLEPIDLLIGGSPCQSFSFAGKRAGMSTIDKEEIYTLKRYLELKREGFLFEGESYLFWEYMRILTDIRMYNPDVLFLLENVEMGKKWERVLSEAIGIFGVHINSALVSAQNRARIYWTNIRTKKVGLFGELHADIPQPQDRKIFLRHIVEEEADKKLQRTLENMDREFEGLSFTNLVDYDMLYGHRRDVDGYAKALAYFDEKLPEIQAHMRPEDILMITADHGCDPAYTGTDHTREYVPILVWHKGMKGLTDLGTRATYADMAATVAEYLGIPERFNAVSFLEKL